MRMTRILTATNWRYALGELILIVSGILIAIAANSWYEDRALRSEEIRVLRQIGQSLEEDYRTLLNRSERLNRFSNTGRQLYDFLLSAEPVSEPITSLFSAINGVAPLELRTAPFEALKSRGFDLISDESLRIQLIELYDDLYERAVRNVLQDTESVHETIRPYLMEHFLRDPSDSWIPKDLDDVRASGYLANLCKMRAYNLDEYTLLSMRRAVDGNQRVSQSINEILKRSD